jgi:hypothetical protein
MLAILLWQLAALARSGAQVRPLIAVIALATLTGTVIAWHFIIPVPALFSLALVASLAVAYATAR